MSIWGLPQTAVIGGVEYHLNTAFRDVLEIFSYLNDPDQPEWVRWQIAVGLFYEEELPEEYQSAAMEYLASFIACGEEDSKPGHRLLDWEQDAQIIAADINKVAGTEVRALPHLHWWTFLSYFRGIGEGQLSTIVSIREKLRTGKKLEKWEKEFEKENRELIRLTKKSQRSKEELNEIRELLGLARK